MSHFLFLPSNGKLRMCESRLERRACLEGLPSTLVFPCLLAMENDNNAVFSFSIVEDFPPRFKRLNFPFFSSYIKIGSRNAFSRIFRDFLSSFLGFLHVYRGFLFVRKLILLFLTFFLRACLSEKNVCVLNRAMLWYLPMITQDNRLKCFTICRLQAEDIVKTLVLSSFVCKWPFRVANES